MTPSTVTIPSDIDRDDRLIANLTARQLVILAITGLLVYAVWAATRTFLPWPVFVAITLPVAVLAAAVAFGQRDGVSLDRLLIAAIRHLVSPRRRVDAPEGITDPPGWVSRNATNSRDSAGQAPAPLDLPVTGVADAGLIDLGPDGAAVVATCSPVNFALRTPEEQETVVAAFGRYLHSLTAPAQILVRVEQLDLSEQITSIRDNAPAMPHPALEQASRSHAEFLADLGRDADLLHRQALLVLREPRARTANPVRGRSRAGTDAQRHAADTRLARRLTEAASLLGPAGIIVTPLGTAEATAVLRAACNPDSAIPPSASIAGPDEVITTAQSNHTTVTDDGDDSDPRVSEFRRRYI